MMIQRIVLGSLVGIVCQWTLVLANAAPPSEADLPAARERAVAFLKSTQSQDGTWTTSKSIGITGLAAYGLLNAGVPPEDKTVAAALAKIESCAQADGSLCVSGSRLSGYETAIAIMALQAADSSGRYSGLVEKAVQYLRSVQLDESKGVAPDDPRYGGAAYNASGGRSDLSNTTFFLEALQAAGISPHDAAVQKSVHFLSRCQNLKSEFNESPDAAKINDGGFRYQPSGEGREKSIDPQALRSYGSMTYAGFKSMLYAGLNADDPRVKGAREWIQKAYSVTENPGQGNNGLYYYYYLMARALDAADMDQLVDAAGVNHDWRSDLVAQLLKIQQPNGSWVNQGSDRWFEGDPNLVTAYVLVVLNHCDSTSSSR